MRWVDHGSLKFVFRQFHGEHEMPVREPEFRIHEFATESGGERVDVPKEWHGAQIGHDLAQAQNC